MLLLRKSPGNARDRQQSISDRRKRIWNKFLSGIILPSSLPFFLPFSLPSSLPPSFPLLYFAFLSSSLKLPGLTKIWSKSIFFNCFKLKVYIPLLWTYPLNPYLLLAPPELSCILLPRYMGLLRSLWECSNILAFISYLVKWRRPKLNPHKESGRICSQWTLHDFLLRDAWITLALTLRLKTKRTLILVFR